jgi:hypothetical protein
MEVMTKEFVLDILNACCKHGYLPENYVHNFERNMKIRNEFRGLRRSGMASKAARRKLSEDYCTSMKNIEGIVYVKEKNAE